ncbi:class I SAM-dependent methyltransferase [Nocardia crassostreae]|uniref:class I SAM-dependent methyltransferase n=1 Tax=Nocardia crassostreae TaxID=53428 RepID=UPI000B1BEC45|nr:class I SAM-dependent methyltransferase [Nocardia crassostreae]
MQWALEPVRDRSRVEVLDLGAGTGKLTGVVLETGVPVRAVEPDAAMRAALRERFPEVSALAGTAESIPLPDDSVDAVGVGMAFHFFDQARAFPEIARVLRPGGVVAALWNDHDDSVEWVAELGRVSRSTLSLSGRARTGVPDHPLFRPFEQNVFPHSHRRTADGLTATIGTHSHTLIVTPEERAEVLGRIAAFLHGRPETATGEFDLPLRTTVVRATLRPARPDGPTP